MVESVKNEWEDYRERVLVSPCNHLRQDVTVVESFGNELRLSVNCTYKLSYIPGEIFLKTTFTSNTEIHAKCIESDLCGVD